ncbi:MAG: T9SS C-terminal target domain-containing protein [Bacteroidetes bacterium]|nr:MAG: T9SS C-terminal target domain-containing protein [Bacteroidota bacterium]
MKHTYTQIATWLFFLLLMPFSLRVQAADWFPLSTGVAGSSNPIVFAIEISGTSIYAGGSFTSAGGNTVNRLAVYNGTTWTAIGGGLNGAVRAIAIIGNNIYVGGDFTNAGGNANADYVAYWDGTAWQALGIGTNGNVNALAVQGNLLYVGGSFTQVNGGSTRRIARWNTSTNTWSQLGSGVGGTVFALETKGDRVYVGGDFNEAGGISTVNRIAFWDNSIGQWNKMGLGANSAVYAIAARGNDVFVGGAFNAMDQNVNIAKIARWDVNNETWNQMATDINGNISAISLNDGNVYVGGALTVINGTTVNGIARWDGDSWNSLNTGVNGTVSSIALTGEDVYAGGGFTLSGCGSCSRISRFGESTSSFPVEWLSFEANQIGNNVRLEWSTASESQNLGFSVERSVDASIWEETAFVKGKNDTREVSEYSWDDVNPFAGKIYYRLRQVDVDGAFHYSSVITLTFTREGNLLHFYPNPAQEQVNVSLPQGIEPAQVLLLDLAGRVMASYTVEAYELSIPVQELRAGLYLIQVTQNRQSYYGRLIRQ